MKSEKTGWCYKSVTLRPKAVMLTPMPCEKTWLSYLNYYWSNIILHEHTGKNRDNNFEMDDGNKED